MLMQLKGGVTDETLRVKTGADLPHMDALKSYFFESEAEKRETWAKCLIELIKLKAVYELLETITDRCEDAANLIEGIVLENS